MGVLVETDMGIKHRKHRSKYHFKKLRSNCKLKVQSWVKVSGLSLLIIRQSVCIESSVNIYDAYSTNHSSANTLLVFLPWVT